MFTLHHLRFLAIVDDVTTALIDMALDPRLVPGVASEIRSLKSSASTPSLRSREGSVTPVGGRMDSGGGNVRVVVRVRGFLPRGELQCIWSLFEKSLVLLTG